MNLRMYPLSGRFYASVPGRTKGHIYHCVIQTEALYLVVFELSCSGFLLACTMEEVLPKPIQG